MVVKPNERTHGMIKQEQTTTETNIAAKINVKSARTMKLPSIKP